MKQIDDFASRFGVSLRLSPQLVVEKDKRFFLLNQNLKQIVTGDFYYAGVYLGKVKRNTFFPGFPLLAMIAKRREANRIIVDGKTEWLFICGRDVFRRGIVKITGSKRSGDYTLILNEHDECLGFGRLLRDLTRDANGQMPVVKNVSDVGDFLRRERRRT